jgi:hypothetical protein
VIGLTRKKKEIGCKRKKKNTLCVALEHGISPPYQLIRETSDVGRQDSGEEKEGVNVNAHTNL